MDQINPPDEKTPTIKTEGNLVEVLLTPEEQAHITKLRAEEVAPVSDLNILEATTQSAELTEQAPEKKKLTEKQKKIAAFILSGLILAGIVTGTIFANDKGKDQPINNPTITEPSKAPTQTTTSPETTTIVGEVEIPEEAKSFVDMFQDRYADPVSVYYAEKSYRETIIQSGAIFGDEFLNSIEILNYRKDEKNIIGFFAYKLPLSAESNSDTAIKVFNEDTSINLSLYLNDLARNPSQKATDIIDHEFRLYCSNADMLGEPQAFSHDDAEIDMLMDTAKKIVAEYGSAANYSVAKATTSGSDPNMTQFNTAINIETHTYTAHVGTDTYKHTMDDLQSGGVKLVINIDAFNGDKVTHIDKILDSVQMSIIRQPSVSGGTESNPDEYTYISIGQR